MGPFATLPEQFEAIKQFEANQLKIDRPDLSEDQINELNQMLHLKIAHNALVKFTIGALDTSILFKAISRVSIH